MELEDILVQMKMLSEGIVPYEGYSFVDINKALDSLSPVEKRKAKRKFRKLWRKAASELDRMHNVKTRHSILSTFDLCVAREGKCPTRAQRRSRSSTVRRYLLIRDE